MLRTDIINFLIKKYNFKNYLEIGVASGTNIQNVKIENKDGVDPGLGRYSDLSKLVNYKMDSDSFFSTIDSNKKYDFIFIDGLHHSNQVDKDIENSLKHLSETGVIMLHDTIPSSFEAQIVPRIQTRWNGDVWKSVVNLRYKNQNLYIMTLDTDEGCTLIKRGTQELYNDVNIETALTYEYFKQNKIKLMNIVSIEFFKETF